MVAREPINEEKLRQLIKERIFRNTHIVSLADLSKELGYTSSFMSNSLRAGVLNKAAVTMLDKIYGIKYEEYALVEDEEITEKIEKVTKLVAELTAKELSELIYTSVYAAVMHAYENDQEVEYG